MSLNYHFLLSLSILLFITQTSLPSSASKLPIWEGSAYAEVNVPTEKAWPFVEDFCNAYKIYPVTISFCEKGDPKHVKPGDQRLTGVFMNGTDEVQFEQHRLLKIDRVKRYITYKMMANNLNVTYYKVTVSVMPSKKIKNGSLMRWHYKIRAVKGYDHQMFVHVFQSLVDPVPGSIHKWLAKHK
uniref:Apoplastic protein n=1 Tax=Arnebia euchroma TaxID=373122 RepID=A7J9M0_ARNEU|nr:apoplastic protein [Arnebia euchroma]